MLKCQTGTTVLEFLPGFVSILLAGNMGGTNSQHYVDAATISVMVRTVVLIFDSYCELTYPVQLLNVTAQSLGLGLASALDTLCSQAYGAKSFDKIGIYFQTGVLMLSIALVPMLIVNSFAEPILNWLGQHAEVTELTRDFSRLMLPGLPFLFLYELVRKVMQSQNIVKPLVAIAVVGNLVNLAAGYGLAYHTSLGFNGIAVARSLGNITLALLLVPYFIWRPQQLRQWWGHGWDFKAARSYIGLFWQIGCPGMVMMAVEVWAFEILAILSGILPDSVVALATHSVLMNVNIILYTAFYGIAVASSIRVGNCLGADQPKKAKMACNLALVITLGVSIVFAVLLFSLSDYIPKLFLDNDQSINLASKIMARWAPLEIADGLNAVMQGIFRGAGRQKPAAIANVIGYYGGGIPLGAILAFVADMGVEGLWWGIGFGITATWLTLTFLMLRFWEWDQLVVEVRQRTAR
ncbi:Multidrug and toxin extrusion protein 1 [Phytophthora citrophthora]|uniref:Multidrug and toxin extrusion protein 1 n=1 Tax=Phytophthora citrophthora TaxID=4793 RepID=A0AAD9GLW4_9STRA|nr:Multidrug and toxin extrusion protein 1 [Phytophthora citrophthora]